MKSGLFRRIFPPPEFLSIPAMGMDVSDESIHLMELVPAKGGLRIGRYGSEKVAEGILEEGDIQDIPAFADLLVTLRKKYGLKFANISLPEQHGYVVVVRIPKMDLKNVYANIELQLEEHVPLPANEAVFSYDVIHGLEPDAREMELNLTAYPRAMIEKYVEAFTQAGIVPLRFEIEAHATARCVIPEDTPGVYMLVDLGLTRTGIYIVRDGYLRFSSTVNLGGNTLTNALARELKLSFKEADTLMQTNGLTNDPDDPQTTQIARALMPTISAMQDEIGKHHLYWNTHTDNYGKQRPPIDRIMLVGGLANLPGFPEYLEANLKTHVDMANVFVNVNPLRDYVPPIPYNYSLTYAPAIGLALLQS